ncbi:hypothetical protein WR25_09535 [Diploscapter pachys]|uniref:Uncharacterized protein n=1 Tax=Diploscapter pachys TaxID=2018661 RepID=A0A2A2KQ56_9BILA|nr:hypothetical protein WR25_09535 [Diploscapter pachys]
MVAMKNQKGEWVYPFAGKKPEAPKKTIINVADESGNKLQPDEQGNVVLDDGTTIQVDDEGNFIRDGEVITPDDSGSVLIDGKEYNVKVEEKDEERPDIPLIEVKAPDYDEETTAIPVTIPTQMTTKESVIQVILPDGTPLRADDQGNYLTDDGKIIRKDDDGNFVDEQNREDGTVLDIHGQPISTDSSGHPLSKSGEPLPTTNDGKYVSGDEVHTTARILPTDDQSQPLPEDQFIFITETQTTPSVIATDDSGKKIYPVVRPDGTLLATDSSGRFITDEGVPIEIDDQDRPLGPDNEPLAQNKDGQYILPVIGFDGKPLPTHPETKLPIYPVVDQEGTLPEADLDRLLRKTHCPRLVSTSDQRKSAVRADF